MRKLLSRFFGRSNGDLQDDATPQGDADGARSWNRPGAGRIVPIGWLLDAPKSGFIWSAPRSVAREVGVPQHAKSVNFCPSVRDYDARMWDVPCPISVGLRFKRDANGKPSVVDLDGERSSIRPSHLSKMVAMVGEKEWRHPDRPIIQFITPYLFVADEPVWLTQLPPVSHFRPKSWPGLVIGGRLPIHIWPRHMMWAFEWWDTSKDLTLIRGEPWFHIRFETNDPTRHVRLIEAELTPAVREYIDALSSVANYVDKTFSLFKTAEERRPDQLVTEKRRS